MAKKSSIISVIIVILFLVISPSCFNSANSEARAHYQEVLNKLSSYGYGVNAFSNNNSTPDPMAYSLITSAEAHRYVITGEEDALSNMLCGADWLVANSDLNNNGLVGWGLLDAWDAFSDGSVNPPNTEYAITTALAVQGLLDTFDAINPKRPSQTENNTPINKETYLQYAELAMNSYIDSKAYNTHPNSRVAFWYSLRPEDSYEVINIEAMFAGILQRLAVATSDSSMAITYSEFADQVVNYMLDFKEDYNQAWLWGYCGRYAPSSYKPRLNDSVHAAYVVDGLMMYHQYGGRLGNQIEDVKLLAGLEMFITDGQVIELPGQDTPARIWGVGYLLYVINRYFENSSLGDVVYNYTVNNYWVNDEYQFNTDNKGDVRHPAHVLIGLSFYAYR